MIVFADVKQVFAYGLATQAAQADQRRTKSKSLLIMVSYLSLPSLMSSRHPLLSGDVDQ